jgi:hypothetical protein
MVPFRTRWCPGRDAAVPVQVDQGFHVDRFRSSPCVEGDCEAGWAAAKDAHPASPEQLVEALGGEPVSRPTGGGCLGDLVQETDRVGVRLGPCC